MKHMHIILCGSRATSYFYEGTSLVETLNKENVDRQGLIGMVEYAKIKYPFHKIMTWYQTPEAMTSKIFSTSFKLVRMAQHVELEISAKLNDSKAIFCTTSEALAFVVSKYKNKK